MNYIALYRKWRPKTFTDVVGQKQVSETLMRAIRENRVAHAYLFSGPRGTGKTSMAKIFARAINCEHGPTDTPCNSCTACRQILGGQSMDVLEIDAASNRGIDEIRALRESVKYLPVEGRKKIFIIDEAHMLTTEAWNALLKTVEEPPEHVMFIFATTEAEKLPVTILSRCQRYSFKRITAEDIARHLLYIAEESKINIEPPAARLIAIQADGGLRDALSLLDQCSGMAETTITVSLVEELTGLVSKQWLIDLLEAITKGDGAHILIAVKEALSEGRDARQIVDSLAQHVRALLLGKVLPTAEELSVYETVKSSFQEQCERLPVEMLDYVMGTLQQIQMQSKKVENPRIIVEMGLLSLCSQSAESADISNRLARLERSERMAVDAVLDRLAKLEAKQIVNFDGKASHSGGNGNVKYEDRFELEDIEQPALGQFETSVKSRSLPKPQSLTLGKRLPKKKGTHEKADGGEAVATSLTDSRRPLINPATYGKLAEDAVQALQAHKYKMTAALYKSGEVVYADEGEVVFSLDTTFNTQLGSRPKVLDEVRQAVAAVLRKEVKITVVAKNSAEEIKYRSLLDVRRSETESISDVQEATVMQVHRDEEEHKEMKRWNKDRLSDEEKEDVALVAMLEDLEQDHDIYVEYIHEEEK